ncbi:hypothetical protein BO78DRAFT_431900 [Aspergillus sclerotiicarbonarius CBS 121057]|uniref:Isochorismatase-like domain-containing protein n=1 Tax=Aspergillus sclerotiicarbonarius (strain CBS 121057 / IBT 28362) TaxID=1448318 RepID=A0A319E691_ASPSB|nr:hypothetical protein BO78DRAFT_431900 [Aspergillus sclerotiicarbonarius CBS 121057]
MSSRTALFVIDIQNELAISPETRIPHSERILTASTEILKTARSIIDAHRETSRLSPSVIVFVQHEEGPANGGTLIKGTEPWELCFQPRAGVEEEIYVSKTTGDTFKSNRELAPKLRAAGVTDIVAFGLQSEMCVEATCTGALAAGFRVTLLAGAHSTYDNDKEGKMAVELEREVERRLSTRGAKVVGWEKAVKGWVERQRIKGTFKFYSDWALFQTSDPTQDNYSLGIRFDQKGHERPFQKAVIVDIQDGYLNPGDRIVIRLGDRRYGGGGTRAQTFVEKDFRWRFYIDPVGTSRFAPIQPDLSWKIVAGPIHRVQIVSPRVLRPSVPFAVHAHTEDIWGNATSNLQDGSFELKVSNQDLGIVIERQISVSNQGWTNAIFSGLTLDAKGDYTIEVTVKARNETTTASSISHLTVSPDLPVPKALFGDLHVHSDDTVGTESSIYNFSYGREIAALDVLGYTAHEFQITKEHWDATIELIQSLNKPGEFVIFPGTEWCGNSAAGGDHNVVFLADPATHPPEFPFDRHGNVARSFEWSEHGPKDLVPGAWPLDEVYCTYAQEADTHLLIPHVGGRCCNLAWHHPQLEHVVEIGSAWGRFEWLLRDAVRRGWKLGVSANSDEHRGRCGGGVPGTAVFGTRGGLTGIIAPRLERQDVADTLRARHTFATTGQRLVGLVQTADGSALQGDEIQVLKQETLELDYHFLGEKGFSSIEAFDTSGLLWRRHFWSESDAPATILRVTWGGARLYDRYREAVWNGTITVSEESTVQDVLPFGGLEDNVEDYARTRGKHSVEFSSKTSGDLDSVHVNLQGDTPRTIRVAGSLGGYVKVGDVVAGNPHKAQPTFQLEASWEEIQCPDGKLIEILGGAELFVRVEAIPRVELPQRIQFEHHSVVKTLDRARSTLLGESGVEKRWSPVLFL